VIVIPQYVMFNQFGWINTFFPLIVPKLLATDAFFIFLMVQFIRGLPSELMEAAEIDGCGYFQIFTRIVLPLVRPALATTAVFTFIWTWNDFFQQLVYLTQPRLYTVPLALNAFQDSTGESAWGPLFAMALLSLGPLIGFFIAAQRHLVRGIATTGLK
jgi:multiple sugar transport system permease protein